MTTLEEVHGPSWPEEERQAWAAFLAIFPAMAEEVYSDMVRADQSNRLCTVYQWYCDDATALDTQASDLFFNACVAVSVPRTLPSAGSMHYHRWSQHTLS